MIDIIDFDTAIKEWRRVNDGKTTVKEDPKRWQTYDSLGKSRRASGVVGTCPTCGAIPGERGLVRFNWPVGHAYFGHPVRCPTCNSGGRKFSPKYIAAAVVAMGLAVMR